MAMNDNASLDELNPAARQKALRFFADAVEGFLCGDDGRLRLALYAVLIDQIFRDSAYFDRHGEIEHTDWLLALAHRAVQQGVANAINPQGDPPYEGAT
jgi:hypothetical protein